MKQALLFGHALVCSASALAAGAPAPSMKFLAAPAVERSGIQHREVLQYRSRDALTVVIKEPAACGVRPAQPSFGLKDGTLLLRYRIEGGTDASAARGCAATAIFVLKNLPRGDLKVVAEAQRAPVATAIASASGAASMKFLSVPASFASDAHAGVSEYRLGDALTVVVRERADCGQRPSDPSFRVADGALQLGYTLPETSVMTSGAPCLATAVFTFKNLPEQGLRVLADAHRTPTLVAASGNGPGGASMKFMAVPAAVDGGSGEREVLEHRSNDTLTVVIRDRAECGRRPADPSFDVVDSKLVLRYNVPTGDAGARPTCRSTAIFTLRHLPEGDLQVIALANPEPVAEAALGSARMRGPKLRTAAAKAKAKQAS